MAGIDPMSSNVSPVFGDYIMDTLGKGQALANLPYQEYTGQRYAGFTPLQQQAFTGIGALQLPGQFGMATDMANSAVGGIAGNFLDAGDVPTVNRFMNPYQQGVTDIAKREAQRTFDMGQAGRDYNAAQAGAFGGSRHGIVQAEGERNLMQQLNDIQMRGGDAAYKQAMDSIAAQRSAGIAGANTQLQGAGILGNLGNSQFGVNKDILQGQLNAGGMQQDQAQKPLDFGYQQFMESMKYPQQQVEFQKSLLSGLPLSMQPTAAENPWLNALAGGAGIYSLLKGG